MKDLVTYLATSLVDEPKEVEVKEEITKEEQTIYLSVKQEDLGKIIGKKGRTAKAMRTLLSAACRTENKQIVLQIVEPKVKEAV